MDRYFTQFKQSLLINAEIGCGGTTLQVVGDRNDRSKGKLRKICRTTSRIRDRDGFIGNTRKSDALQIRHKEKSLQVSMAVVSTSLIAGPVFNPNYDAIVDIRSLKETEGVSKRVMNWQIFFLANNALR